jgi:hypothetical protein
MSVTKKQYELLKKKVQQEQGNIHSDILILSEEEQMLLYTEALEEGTILGEDEIASTEDDLKQRIEFVKQLATLIQ